MSQDFPSFYKLSTSPPGGPGAAGRGAGQRGAPPEIRGRAAVRAELSVLPRRGSRRRRGRRRADARRSGIADAVSGLSSGRARGARPHAGVPQRRRRDDDGALRAPGRTAGSGWPGGGRGRHAAVRSCRRVWRRARRTRSARGRRERIQRLSVRRRRARRPVLHGVRPRQPSHHERAVVPHGGVQISTPEPSSGRCRSESTGWRPRRAAPPAACHAARSAWE